jgi:mycothiol synthase
MVARPYDRRVDELIWRPANLDDVPGLTVLSNTVSNHVGARDMLSEEAMAQQLRTTRWDITSDSLLAVCPDGSIVGCAGVPPPHEGQREAQAFGAVDPKHRGRGIGRRLLAWQVERAVAHRTAAAATEPWALYVSSADSDESAGRLFARFGFRPVRYWYDMERPVADPVASTPLADGLRIVRYEPRYEDGLYAAHMEAFSDHWGFQWRPQAEWRQRLSTVSFRPQQTFLAVTDADEVAGYLVTCGYEDPTRLTMATIGTRRTWRRKGVASSLIAAALAGYREVGVRTANLGVDTANPTGALRVYERMGFRPTRGATTFSRDIG